MRGLVIDEEFSLLKWRIGTLNFNAWRNIRWNKNKTHPEDNRGATQNCVQSREPE